MALKRNLVANISLAILAPVVFFSLTEGIFFLAGVKPLFLTEDPYVGFASTQPLFIEQKNADGTKIMVTNPVKMTHFNPQSFTPKKAPGTYRIFSVGGSTAYGHPWKDPTSFSGWLRELLPAADSTRKWEVINAGGISYASYREAKLIEEMIQYQPDLFLVYSGHNEFLEERTYRKAAHVPAVVRELSSLLDHTRTYSVMRRLLRSMASGGQPKASDAQSGSSGSSAANPDASGSGASSSSAKPFNMASEVDDVLAKTIGPTSYVRDDTLHQEILEHYRASLNRMALLAHSVGAEVIFLTTPGNEKDCSPFKSEPKDGLTSDQLAKALGWARQGDSVSAKSQEVAGASSAVQAAIGKTIGTETTGAGASGGTSTASAALSFYDSALAIDDRNADLYYKAGKAAFAAARYPEAKHDFQRAMEEDICPLRALPAMRAIVLTTARDTRAQAIDFTDLLEQKTRKEHGHDVLGEPDFVDHVHLSIDDYRFMALSIIDKLKAMGVVKPGANWNEATIKAVADRVMAKMGPHELGEGLHNLAKVVNWAGKHEDAARIAERALAVDSQGLEAIWSSLFVGAARERQGKESEAIPHYRRAVRLDPSNPMSRHYLAAALMRLGSDAEAASEFEQVLERDPSDVDARSTLGMLDLKLGKPVEAANQLAQAVQAYPNRTDMLCMLGEAQLESRQTSQAEETFRRALAMNPREARALVGLAKIAESQGNMGEAINLYAKALSIAPQLQEARAALSRALGGLSGKP